MSRAWTQEQKNAIDARDGTLLVSAAAGSGKTAVLVQRVIERLTDPIHPSDADRLLVVTFTKAAAAEMKDRIAARISELLAQDPTNRNLQRQQLLLGRAQISTIHSFCNELIKENFYKLNLSPELRIVDSSELTLLKQTAITNVLERNYEQQDQAFADLVEAFSSDRDDSRIIQTVEAYTNLPVPILSLKNGWMKKRLCINILNRLPILLGDKLCFPMHRKRCITVLPLQNMRWS